MAPAKRTNWGEHALPNRLARYTFGTLTIRLKRQDDELWLAASHGELKSAVHPSQQNASWSRYVLETNDPKVRFSPVLPDRPIIIKPEHPFKLVPRASTRIYVQVPLWVRIELIAKSTTRLQELATTILSNTWFGGTDEGELCYWLATPARRQVPQETRQSYSAICPIQIINRASEELTVEKLALRVERLTLFDDGGIWWTDLTTISYRGPSEVSRVEVSGSAPREAPHAQPAAPPRAAGKKGFSAKTFGSFLDLAGLDWLR